MNQEAQGTSFLVADDHGLIRQAIVLLLDGIGIDYKVFQASSIHQIKDCINAHQIDIAIMDAHFPDGNSLHLIPEIKSLHPEMKILIFTGIEEDIHSLKFLNAGADGFLSKLSEESEVQNAILKIVNDGEYISPVTKIKLMSSLRTGTLINPLSLLTDREMQVAEMYAKGHGNLEIANTLNVRQNTISTVKKRIFHKLKIENIVELIDLMKNHSDFL
jgi:DNA-binding NarL/FixJ family response regulator